MKLNKEILKIFEDINFLIDNDEVSLNKTSVKDLSNQQIAYYANLEVYKALIKENKFEDCLNIWKNTGIKYLVLSNREIRKIIYKTYNECCLYKFNLNWLDTKNITNMSYLFKDMIYFNGNISDWDVSNVESMESMFNHAKSFNLLIGNWDTSNVNDMSQMFCNAYSFNLPIGNWDISNVKRTYGMFTYAVSFNLDISKWDVSNVENMSVMFQGAKSFNLDISNWNISKTCKKYNIFDNCLIKNEYKFNRT